MLRTCAGWLRGAFFGGVTVLEVENVLGDPTPSLSLVNRASQCGSSTSQTRPVTLLLRPLSESPPSLLTQGFWALFPAGP